MISVSFTARTDRSGWDSISPGRNPGPEVSQHLSDPLLIPSSVARRPSGPLRQVVSLTNGRRLHSRPAAGPTVPPPSIRPGERVTRSGWMVITWVPSRAVRQQRWPNGPRRAPTGREQNTARLSPAKHPIGECVEITVRWEAVV